MDNMRFCEFQQFLRIATSHFGSDVSNDKKYYDEEGEQITLSAEEWKKALDSWLDNVFKRGYL